MYAPEGNQVCPSHQPWWWHVLGLPRTEAGWWSARLTAGFAVLLVFIFAGGWRFLIPMPVFAIMACGLAAGIVGLLAVFCQHERSWLVWLALVPMLLVVAFLIAEFTIPH